MSEVSLYMDAVQSLIHEGPHLGIRRLSSICASIIASKSWDGDRAVQGYLAYKKPRPPRTVQEAIPRALRWS